MSQKNIKNIILILISTSSLLACHRNLTQPYPEMPEIVDVEGPGFRFIGDTGSLIFMATVDDPQGIEDVQWVTMTVHPEMTRDVILVDTLLDNGNGGDEVPGDGVFSLETDFFVDQLDEGYWWAELVAVDAKGYESPTEEISVVIVEDDGLSPVIFNVVYPREMAKDDTTIFISTSEVYNPEGLGEIDSVFVTPYRPNGDRREIIKLYDDGVQNNFFWDLIAGDGIYSRAFFVPPPVLPIGDWRFVFEAHRGGGVVSNQVTIVTTVW